MRRWITWGWSLLWIWPQISLRAGVYETWVARALQNHPDIQEQILRLDQSREEKRLGYAPLFPKLTAAWNLNKNSGRTAQKAWSTQVSQTVFSGGAEYSTLAALERRVHSQEALLEDARDQVKQEVAEALLEGAWAGERKHALESSLTFQEARVQELQRRRKIGQTREPDLIQAELEQQKIQRRILQTESEYATAQKKFSEAVREQQHEFEFPPLEELTQELRYSEELKARKEYGLSSLESELEALEYERKSLLRSYLPSLSAFGGTSPYPGLNNVAWNMGLKAQWTLFEGFKTPRQVGVLRSQISRVNIQIAALKFQREQSVSLIHQERKNSVAQLKDLREVIARAERALKIQEQDYRQGIVTSLEVQSSLQTILDLRLEQAELRYRLGLLRAQSMTVGAL